MSGGTLLILIVALYGAAVAWVNRHGWVDADYD